MRAHVRPAGRVRGHGVIAPAPQGEQRDGGPENDGPDGPWPGARAEPGRQPHCGSPAVGIGTRAIVPVDRTVR
jgi:hypothetical protein